MLARFFKKSEPIGFISLLLLLAVYIIIQFFIGSFDAKNLKSVVLIFGVFLFFASYIFIADFIIKKNQLTPLNYYAILVFVLLIGLFPSVLNFSSVSFSHFFFLLAARRIYSLHTKKQLLVKLFEGGLYIGIAFLIYPITSLFIILIYVGYSIYIHMINKDLIVPIIGFFTPIFVVFSYCFFVDDLYLFRSLTELNIGFNYRVFTIKSLFIPLLIFVVLILWEAIHVFSNLHLVGIRWKNNIKIVFFHLSIAILLIMLNSLQIEKNILFLFFPISIIIGNLFSHIKRYWVKETLLLSLLILTFIIPFL